MQSDELIAYNRAFTEFYFQKIKNRLPEFNKIFSLEKTRKISLIVILSCFTIAFTCPLFLPILFPIFLVAFVFLFKSSLEDNLKDVDVSLKSGENATELANENPYARLISFKLKSQIMSDFVAIFGDFSWFIPNPNEWGNKLKYLKDFFILKSSLVKFDDCIDGSYKGVNLRLVEVDTGLFNVENFGRFIFPVIFGVSFISILLPFLGIIVFSLLVSNFSIGQLLPYLVVILVMLLVCCVLFLRRFLKPEFKGIIVEFDMNKNFEGHTLVLEKSAKKQFDVLRLEEVELEDVVFFENYNVYSDSQIESRYLLTTAFVERINNIKSVFKAEYVRVAFKDKKIVLAIHTNRDMFKLADYIKPTGRETFIELFNEMISVLDFVEYLKLNQKIGL
jgi:hypothetical protein